MEVMAIKPGYHGKLRAVGDRFDVPSGSKATWFAPIRKEEKAPVGKAAQSSGEPSGADLA